MKQIHLASSSLARCEDGAHYRPIATPRFCYLRRPKPSPMRIETFIAKPSVERFYERVIRRLALDSADVPTRPPFDSAQESFGRRVKPSSRCAPSQSGLHWRKTPIENGRGNREDADFPMLPVGKVDRLEVKRMAMRQLDIDK